MMSIFQPHCLPFSKLRLEILLCGINSWLPFKNTHFCVAIVFSLQHSMKQLFEISDDMLLSKSTGCFFGFISLYVFSSLW